MSEPLTAWGILAHAALLNATHIGRKCEQPDCCGVARWMIHWPGREPALRCEPHTAWTRHVAAALGFELWAEPVEVRELDPAPPDHTAERFAAMELD
jgi:hypothetical protein